MKERKRSGIRYKKGAKHFQRKCLPVEVGKGGETGDIINSVNNLKNLKIKKMKQ